MFIPAVSCSQKRKKFSARYEILSMKYRGRTCINKSHHVHGITQCNVQKNHCQKCTFSFIFRELFCNKHFSFGHFFWLVEIIISKLKCTLAIHPPYSTFLLNLLNARNNEIAIFMNEQEANTKTVFYVPFMCRSFISLLFRLLLNIAGRQTCSLMIARRCVISFFLILFSSLLFFLCLKYLIFLSI